MRLRAATLGVLLVAAWCALPIRATQAAPPTFEHDVQAVLSKAGCNQGTCHGNQNGKGGFKLSLRGQDTAGDRRALLHEAFERRVNPLEPEQSLLLLKATAAVSHSGGRRFRVDSPEYVILRDWIASGPQRDPKNLARLERLEVEPAERYLPASEDRVQLRVTATFADGAQRDVTRWAVYTPSQPIVAISPSGLVTRERDGETTIIVRYLDQQTAVRLALLVPARPDFVWQAPPAENVVDRHIWAKLERLRMNPSELCSDTVFLRRAHLDLLGGLPTEDEARAFFADTQPDKRARLVDVLLERPEFADYWALKWADLLRAEERMLDRKGLQTFHQWLRRMIAEGRPVDEFARDLLAARGSTYKNPPANFYRAHRDPITRAESVGQVFLGVRLQCAKCHNHPFDRWTQDDYYRWAGVFARVQYKVIDNQRRDRNDKHEFDGEQIVYMASRGEVMNPGTNEPAPPKFLGDRGKTAADADPLEAMASWLVSAENPYFARVQVNRIWYHLFGRGIVEPVDDFRASNPPINPELLESLAAEFTAGKYDLRQMIRLLMRSRTYQLSALPNATNADDEANFSHTFLRPLSAEPLLDALHQATGTATNFRGYPDGVRATQLPGMRAEKVAASGSEEEFLVRFGKPPRLLSCECERTTEPTLNQTFQLVSGPQMQRLLSASGNRLATLLKSTKSDTEIIDELFWSSLSRPPSDTERNETTRYLQHTPDRRRALEDILWSLLNSKEFLLRQ